MKQLDDKIAKIEEELLEVMRDFHRFPELGFQEFRTASKVADHLKNLGFEVQTGIGGTGVIGVLSGAAEGPTIALRACLDALAIQEKSGVEYSSQNDGCMHACGHDGNMTVVLGAAKVLAQYKNVLKGNIKFIFQASEENTGGAAEIIKAGGLENPKVDAIITPHIWHDLPRKTIGMKHGPVMASSDLFKLDIHGVAGHGAWPHMCVDPLPVAAELILAFQRIISREIDPMIPASLSIGRLQYGTAENIISKTVTMYGTVRTFNENSRRFIQERIEEITDHITKSSRATYSLKYNCVMPPLVNDPQFVEFSTALLKKALGNDQVTSEYDSTMGCEEFSVYLKYVPGIFILIGSQNPDEPILEIHNPKFVFPEECLSVGVKALCEIALNYNGLLHD